MLTAFTVLSSIRHPQKLVATQCSLLKHLNVGIFLENNTSSLQALEMERPDMVPLCSPVREVHWPPFSLSPALPAVGHCICVGLWAGWGKRKSVSPHGAHCFSGKTHNVLVTVRRTQSRSIADLTHRPARRLALQGLEFRGSLEAVGREPC